MRPKGVNRILENLTPCSTVGMRQLSAQACLDRARALSLIGVAIPDNRHRLERGRGERTHTVLAGVRNHQCHWCPLDFVLYLQVVWKRRFLLVGGETSVNAGHSEQELACQCSGYANGKYEVSLFLCANGGGPIGLPRAIKQEPSSKLLAGGLSLWGALGRPLSAAAGSLNHVAMHTMSRSVEGEHHQGGPKTRKLSSPRFALDGAHK